MLAALEKWARALRCVNAITYSTRCLIYVISVAGSFKPAAKE